MKLREGTDGSKCFFFPTSPHRPLRSKESSQPIPKAHQARNSLSSLWLGPIVILPPTLVSCPQAQMEHEPCT